LYEHVFRFLLLLSRKISKDSSSRAPRFRLNHGSGARSLAVISAPPTAHGCHSMAESTEAPAARLLPVDASSSFAPADAATTSPIPRFLQLPFTTSVTSGTKAAATTEATAEADSGKSAGTGISVFSGNLREAGGSSLHAGDFCSRTVPESFTAAAAAPTAAVASSVAAAALAVAFLTVVAMSPTVHGTGDTSRFTLSSETFAAGSFELSEVASDAST